MKILMLTDRMDCGGAETHILTLSKALKALGHSVTVCSTGGRLAMALGDISHISLPLASRSPISLLAARKALDHLCEKHKYDIIHSHARIPSLLADKVAKKRGICFVTTVHARFAASPIKRRLSRWGSASVAVSEDLKQYLIDIYKIAPESITVIPNGIDKSVFYPNADGTLRLRKAEKRNIRISFLSRMDKDCSSIAALLCSIAPSLCARFPNIEIALGGEGDAYGEIRALARQANLKIGRDAVRMLGKISDVLSFLRSSDIFVGVSRCSAEAFFCEIPVVLAGNEGFFGRLTSENFLSAAATNFCARECPPADENALLGAISGVIEDIILRGDAVRKGCRELVSRFGERYDISATAKRTELFYKAALASKPSKKSGTLLCGYYGFGNMGDDILLRSAIIRAKNEFPDDSICALTKNGRTDTARFGVRCVKRSSPLSVIKEIGRCRRLIFGGGTLLQDTTSRRSLLFYSSLLRLARRKGAECMLWGNGIELSGRSSSIKMAKKALACCSYVGIRDNRSFELAKALIGSSEPPTIKKEPDLALSASASSKERADYILQSAFGSTGLAFVIAAPKGKSDTKELMLLKQNLLKEREQGRQILFVTMHPRADARVTRSLAKALGGALCPQICFADLIALASRSSGVYSMRFHALVAARIARVYALGIGNSGKIKEFCLENRFDYNI